MTRWRILGPIDIKTVFEDKEAADDICDALNKAWDYCPVTKEQELRELAKLVFQLVHVMRSGTTVMGTEPKMNIMAQRMDILTNKADAYLKSIGLDDPFDFKSKLSHAPAPQIICTCREGSSLPEGQHFVGCGLYKFPVPESERHTHVPRTCGDEPLI